MSITQMTGTRREEHLMDHELYLRSYREDERRLEQRLEHRRVADERAAAHQRAASVTGSDTPHRHGTPARAARARTLTGSIGLTGLTRRVGRGWGTGAAAVAGAREDLSSPADPCCAPA